MANGQEISVLRRKAEAGKTSVSATRQITPCKALSTTFVQVADRKLELVASVSSCSTRLGTLAELLDTLPEGGLLALLEGPGEAQGLMVFDAALLSAVIEQMMMGRLAAHAPEPRRPTRTDAALTADLMDALLRGFEAPFLGTSTSRWSSGFGYASFLDDPRPLGLMLEDIDYRIFSLRVELSAGARTCSAMLALPADGKGQTTTATSTAGSGPACQVSAGAVPADDEEEPSVPWAQALSDRVMPGNVQMTAVLHRMSIPIFDLEQLTEGMELSIPAVALDQTVLFGADGSIVARGRLGQSGGKRAVRLFGKGGASVSAPASALPATPPPPPPMSAATPPEMPSLPDALPPLPEQQDTADEASPDLPSLPDLSDLPDLPDLPAPDALDLPDIGDLPKL